MQNIKVVILARAFVIGSFFLPSMIAAQESDVANIESAMLKKAAQNIEQYRKGEAVISFKTESGSAFQDAEVEITQISHDFLLGAIIFDLVWEENPYRPELFKQRFKDLFNFAVFPFYWEAYEKTQGMPEWRKSLPVIEWCKANGITTKGHPLVWATPSGKPPWLSQYPMDLTVELLKARVINIVGGFKGQIDIWDVVNEPVNVRTWDSENEKIWGVDEPIQKIADYVEKAFKWAYSANPQAHLILNEYYTITKKNTRERFFSLVQELQKRNTPISGLGIQAHEPREEWYPPKAVWETFDRLAELGYPLHITEFIPQSGGKEITGGWRKGTWTLQTQAEFAEQFFRLSFGHPAVVSINWWGLSDRDIWLPGGGLLTEDYTPKPVYDVLKKLIHEEWKTKLSTSTGKRGEVKFRGFYGKYHVKLKTGDGKVHFFDLQVRKDEENKWVFTVK
ncbi:MAG TPA: endo-1,4-beta-xylanase [archaeon]|nr:endo-1,4-beta-xylanase [archaeon]